MQIRNISIQAMNTTSFAAIKPNVTQRLADKLRARQAAVSVVGLLGCG